MQDIFKFDLFFSPSKSSALQRGELRCAPKQIRLHGRFNEALVAGSLLPLCLQLMVAPRPKQRMAERERNSFVLTAAMTFGWVWIR